jgi:Cu2+-exporting ATPase
MSIDSEHPVSRALRQPGHERLSDVDQIQNVPGAGISAQFEGRTWRFGSIAFVEDASMTEALKTDMDALRDLGYTVSVLAEEMTVVAVFAFTDPVRKGVQPMLTALQASGVEQFTILSGDTHTSVSRLADQLGIKDAHGSLSPVDKLDWIARRHGEGRRIAMFGDGINDAPALAAADVSISFSDATDIANVSSDFLVLGADASVLAQARELAQRTRRNIMQNFAWAAAYNFTAVPFAAMGLIPPWGAAIGMSLSSLVVVANALRLQSNGHGKNADPVTHSYKPVGVVH